MGKSKEAASDNSLASKRTSICELRKAGYRIDTVWVNALSTFGKAHRIANYIMKAKYPVQLSLLDQLGGIAG